MTQQEYFEKLKQFEQDTKTFLKGGKSGRIGGIVKTKLNPAIDRLTAWLGNAVGNQPKKQTKFEVVSTGSAKPVAEKQEEPEEEQVERKVLADSETPVKKKRTRKKKTPKQD